ncbi:hypothetical protein CY34DRAFT_811927 [Suillus luteus UH-Slu-Lm8-n1]|uniref:Uncharacterized protein n=1 Tax=Suillus luteus UH-Slu-Lm8-n1 TaxID=930992 RepID=A0A0C9ZDY3_9AGAM|nr:hypothetical protein CY34DRAFT_811927 [Suillus luteus UH-Slu-Lm8-n1]
MDLSGISRSHRLGCAASNALKSFFIRDSRLLLLASPSHSFESRRRFRVDSSHKVLPILAHDMLSLCSACPDRTLSSR